MTAPTLSEAGVFERRRASYVTTDDRHRGARYEEREIRSQTIVVPAPADRDLRVSMHISQEAEDAFYAHIDELDVSAEGETVREAFGAAIRAAQDWLSYLQDENPSVADDLAEQRKYIPLLRAPVFSWFRSFEISK